MRTPVTTGRTPVIAEVADVGRRVDVRRAAPHAVLRVGRVLQGRLGGTRIVDAERHRVRTFPREISDLGIVTIHDQRRVRIQTAHGDTPTLGDMLELAVTVELVPE